MIPGYSAFRIPHSENEGNLCAHCPKRQECAEPCEELEKLLGGPDSGRLSCNISARKIADLEILFSRVNRLNARSHAIVYLYYRCGFAMERIGEAFDLNKSTVSRILQKSWQKVAEKCNTAGNGEEEP